ncbi:MAG TPA: outer membrane protein assembly factor BamA [Casimicrobiaceae bacterium]|nr:outer membrane protein assembly factor BamA [Casimicrobiaceae bacterium]
MLVALALAAPAAVRAAEPFVVRDIRVEGVQRTEAGTIFSYLPIKVGERVDDEKLSAAVKALYATGFFRDVRLEREGDVLVVAVQERPTVSALSFVGNKEFDTETIKKALKDIGIAEARIFDRSALDRAEQELKRQYITRGLYAAKVQTTVTPQERNRVAINFSIDEGEPSRIARINIVGTQAFTEAQLRKEMTLTTPGWLTWYTKNDQYSKQKLQGDLEALRNFYQNRGYLEFDIESTQVSISPDKEDIYITINVREGPRYTVGEVRLAGDLAVDESELRGLVRVREGDVYSREKLQRTAKDISDRLGAEGYAFANVNAVPEIDRAKASAAFTIFVDPGRRVYVRRMNISGNTKTRDEVIRREARQLEGAWFDGQRIERSKVRMKRLGYFDDVNVETPPVPGASDQIDVEFSVTERATGNLLAGLGYSSSDGVVFSGSVSQQNVFGSGNAIALALNTSKINRTYSIVYTEPYWTVDGVSRTIEGYVRRLDPTSLSVSQYASDTIGGAIGFSIPITETDSINLGFRYDHTKLELFQDSPPVYIDFVDKFGSTTDAYIMTLGWARDTRDDILYPNQGRLQSLFLELGLPIGDLAYYKAQYIHQWFWPVWSPFVLMLRGEIGYGDGYSGKPLPFFKAFYAGGVGSVRGFESSSLGPRDVFGNVLGGKRKIVGNAELFYPLLAGQQAVRLSAFADVGQIYLNGLQPDFESFRYSLGAGLAWNSPLGPLKFSYAYPINEKPGDKIQRFQFQVGSVF